MTGFNPILADFYAAGGSEFALHYLCIMTSLYIDIPDAFSVPLTLDFLQRSPRELLHRIDNGRIYKLLRVVDERVLFEIVPEDNLLHINFLIHEPSVAATQYIKSYVREWFDLDTDLQPFYHLVAHDKLLGPLVKQYFGYRIVGQPDLYESLVWAVLGQQINLTFAYTLKQRFVEQFGERLVWDAHTYYMFPPAEDVALLSDADLLPLQFSRQKSQYIIRLAEAFASGEISREKLQGLPLEQAKTQLMKVKGIGNWTANYALMKTFRYPNAFPREDAGLHNAIKNLQGMASKPTLDEVSSLFTRYKGWEAYATLYFWKSL